MKKRLKCLLFGVLMTTGFLGSMPAYGAHFLTTSTRLNFRQNASATSTSLGLIPAESQVDVTDTDGNWGKINYDGKVGYVGLKYLNPVDRSIQLVLDTASPIRSRASLSGTVRKTLAAGSLVTLVDESKYYYKVLIGKDLGWLSKKAATKVVDLPRLKTTTRLNLRTGPGTSYPSLGKVSSARVLPVMEREGNWAKVVYQGKAFWLGSKYTRDLGEYSRMATLPEAFWGFPNKKYAWSAEYPGDSRHGLPEYDSVYQRNDGKVHLTFSSGWEYDNLTPKYLDVLKAKGVRAEFYLTGTFMRDNPDLVKRMAAQGHLIGNHSGRHPDTPTVLETSLQSAYDDLRYWENQYKTIFGTLPSRWYYRPPSGEFSDRLLAITDYLGYHNVLYNVALYDYNVDDQLSETETFNRLMKSTKEGSIVLLHNTSTANLAVLAKYIDAIRDKGWEFADPRDLP